MTAAPVIGRFAPSPTGPLHLGSLVAAVGSWLDARAQGGRWLLRIEDIDPPREHPGAADSFLPDLERHGLTWDGDVLWQHTRLPAYQEALQQLRATGQVYACQCSRRELLQAGVPDCLGPCRDGRHEHGAWRLRSPATPVTVEDRRLGTWQERLQDSCGDIVLWRRDGLPSYQLAVVVDDAASHITDVVRGADLLDNTARQCWLQHCLGAPQPRYLHLPLVIGADARKLSKQSHAPALAPDRAAANMAFALGALGLAGHADPQAPPGEQLQAVLPHWRPDRLPTQPVPAL